MRVLVTGGRAYADQNRVFDVLSLIHAATPIDVVIHGAASGADSLAAEWANQRSVPVAPYPARWDDVSQTGARIRWNKRLRRPYDALAGFRRNTEMILKEAPALCVVFPGGAGTEHCHREALKRGVACLQVEA